MNPRDRAKRAASFAWQERQTGIDIRDHQKLQADVARLAEQLAVPEAELRRDLTAAAQQARTSWKAAELFTGLVFDT